MNEQIKEYRKIQIAEKIAYEVMLWSKYFKSSKTTYDTLIKSVLDEPVFSDKDKNDYIEKSKIILKEKYNIMVISSTPLLLSTNIKDTQNEEHRNC